MIRYYRYYELQVLTAFITNLVLTLGKHQYQVYEFKVLFPDFVWRVCPKF